jgi:deoxycytidylate deaminase
MMRLAKRESRKGSGKYKLGAVITDARGVVVGRGHNKFRTHPSYGHNKFRTHPSYGNQWSGNLHAETDALISALRSKRPLKGGTCYVYRNGGNLAKPCPCCEEFLRSHGIEKVVYSAGEGNFDEMEIA